jgi:hypothetical protein
VEGAESNSSEADRRLQQVVRRHFFNFDSPRELRHTEQGGRTIRAFCLSLEFDLCKHVATWKQLLLIGSRVIKDLYISAPEGEVRVTIRGESGRSARICRGYGGLLQK